MTRLAISVEGPTEEEFVKQFLTDHLREKESNRRRFCLAVPAADLPAGMFRRSNSRWK